MEFFKYFFRVLHEASSSWLKFLHNFQKHPIDNVPERGEFVTIVIRVIIKFNKGVMIRPIPIVFKSKSTPKYHT
jgi:hypothetical protein